MTNFYTNLSVAEITVETGSIAVGDTLMIEGPTTGVYEFVVNEVRLALEPVPQVNKGEVCSVKTEVLVRRGDKVYKKTMKKEDF